MVFHFENLRYQKYHRYKRDTGRKLTKTQLAHELGTHAATLAKLQRGEASTVSIELLERACLFFEVGIDQIMTPDIYSPIRGARMNATQEATLEERMAEMEAEFVEWCKANGYNPDTQRDEAIRAFLAERNEK